MSCLQSMVPKKKPIPEFGRDGLLMFNAQLILASNPLFCGLPPPVLDDLSIHALEYYRHFHDRQASKRLQLIQHRQNQREAYPHDYCEWNTHPQEVSKLVTTSAHDEQVRLITVWRRKAHIGTEQNGQNKRLRTDAELLRDTDSNGCPNGRCRIVRHDIGHDSHQ